MKNKETIGDAIISEIIKQNMITILDPETKKVSSPKIIHWSANSNSQLEALVEEYYKESKHERPITISCCKCGCSETDLQFYNRDDFVANYTYHYRDDKAVYLDISESHCLARHECLRHICKTCGFTWFTDCMDVDE
jgi:hypothetical protein